MIETSARLLAMLSLLQLRREWTGQELADRLEVGPRTIRRDVDKLRGLGYPIEAAPGVAGGYRLGNSGELPPLLLDDAEAVAVAVGLRTVAAAAIEGIEETSVRALAKLEQILPPKLQRRVGALSHATSAFGIDGPRIDAEVLARIASACRDGMQLHFAYIAKDDVRSRRQVEPSAVVYSGYRWYLVAFDIDRDDWRTFRLDRIPPEAPIRVGDRGRRRTVPGGDAAAYVARQVRRSGGDPGGDAPATSDPDADDASGVIRLACPAAKVRGRVPVRQARVDEDGDGACRITSIGPWRHGFLLWTAMLGEEMEIVGPPALAAAAASLSGRLSASLPGAVASAAGPTRR